MSQKQKSLIQTKLKTSVPNKTNKRESDVASTTRAGTIKSITLKNFMCHSHLEVTFSNNVTFITGKNGSGKSAILTGLVVGLGGKASLTNRGNSIKGFIKAGRTSGSVEIVLNNVGDDAYNPEVYGNSIVIQRHFSASGGSSYKIRSEKGELISDKAKEVHNITLAFNIQVDNPVCVLNQDTSRNFLSSSNSNNKFILFQRATRLDILAEEYENLYSNNRKAYNILKDQDQMLKDMENNLVELNNKLEKCRSLSVMKNKVQDLQVEMVWSLVRDAEKELEAERKKVDEMKRKYQEVCENCTSTEEESKTLIEKKKTLEQKVAEIKNAVSVQRQSENDANETVFELKEKLKENKQKRNLVGQTLEVQNRSCAMIENELKNVNETIREVQEAKERRQQNLNKIEARIEEIYNVIKTKLEELFQMKHDIPKKTEEEERLREEVNHIERKIAEDRKDLRSLESGKSNNLLLYGRCFPKILDEISRRKNEFNHLPRGPFGRYISLKEGKWALAIENFLGVGFLKSFGVDNDRDRNILMDIFQKHWTDGAQPGIIISKFFFQVHNVTPNLVQTPNIAGCASMFEMLDVSDPVVVNFIIDQKSVENILLMPSNEVAMEIMLEQRNVPKNCNQGVTIEGDLYYPDPDFRTYGATCNHARFLQVNTEDRIQQLKESIENQTRKKRAIEAQFSDIRKEKQEQTKRMNALEENVRKMEAEKSKLRGHRTELLSVFDDDTVSVEHLTSELEETRRKVLENQAQLDELKSEQKEIEQTLRDAQYTFDSHKRARVELQERIPGLEKEIMETMSDLNELKVTERFAKQQIEEAKDKLQKMEVDFAQKNQELEQKIREAQAVGERKEKLRQVATVLGEINKLKSNIKNIQSTIEKPEELLKTYENAKEQHARAHEMHTNLKANFKELQIAAEKRKRYHKSTEDYLVLYIKMAFEMVLEYMQFVGSLNVDVPDKKLELIVIPQQGSQGHTATENLSGGERSFSTVAFLYSLWQCTNFPVYFLDEFDVYMDKLNRTKVMEVLLHNAKSHPDKQFVFLTPQDVSFLNDKGVAIHRLEDPERRKVEDS